MTKETRFLWQALQRRIRKHGIPPTIKELCADCGTSSGDVRRRLAWLEGAGYIALIPGVSRGIRIVKRDMQDAMDELAERHPDAHKAAQVIAAEVARNKQ